MSVDTYPCDIDKRITRCQLLHSRLMVGQRIITHIAVTIVVIPLGTTRMTATLSDGNHDKSGLCQAVGTHTHPSERIIHGFYLRTRIDIVNNRVNLGRIEIKRLVHYTVQIGHSIGCFYFKRLRELVTSCFQRRKIAFLYRHHLVAVTVQQVRTRDGVGTRIIIHEETGFIVHLHIVEELPVCQLFQSTAVHIHLVEMLVIRILAFLTSVGYKIYGTSSLVHLHHTFYVPRAFRDAVLQVSFVIV